MVAVAAASAPAVASVGEGAAAALGEAVVPLVAGAGGGAGAHTQAARGLPAMLPVATMMKPAVAEVAVAVATMRRRKMTWDSRSVS